MNVFRQFVDAKLFVNVITVFIDGIYRSGFIIYFEKTAIPGNLKSKRIYSNEKPIFVDKEETKLILKPNPAKQYVVIEYNIGSEKGEGIILIRDMKGVLIKNLDMHKSMNEISVDLNGLPAGIYVVSLYAGNKHIQSKTLSVTN